MSAGPQRPCRRWLLSWNSPSSLVAMMWTVAVVSLLLATCSSPVDGAYATTLSVKQPDELKQVMKGGDCWLVACSDMEDKQIGERLVEQAGDSLKGECNVATLKCRKKVSKGVSFVSK